MKATACWGAATLLLLVATGCASGTRVVDTSPPASALRGLADVHWELVQVSAPGGVVAIAPSSVVSWFELSADQAVTGNDGCGRFSARAHVAGDGLVVTGPVWSANGCVSDAGPRDTSRAAVAAVLSGRHVGVALQGNQLDLSVGQTALTYRTPRALSLPTGRHPGPS